jgi:hypothetical protein
MAARIGFGAGEGFVRAADHEGERAAVCRRDPARDRRIDHGSPRPPRSRPPRARWRHRWSSNRAGSRGRGVADHIVPVDRFHDRPVGQHRDDRFGALQASAHRGEGGAPASRARASGFSERSKARTSCPALTRFAAIPPPMLPRPMKAIFMSCTTKTPMAQPTTMIMRVEAEPRRQRSRLPTDRRRTVGPSARSPTSSCSMAKPMQTAAEIRASFTALPLPFALFDEGGHAFGLVLGGGEDLEDPAFDDQALIERHFERRVDHFLVGDGAIGGIAAMVAAVLSVSASSSSAAPRGRRGLLRSASSAPIIRPVRHISIALALPTARVSRCDAAHAGRRRPA